MELWELDHAIKAVCPIYGVRSDKSIIYHESATQAQRDAAQALADAADLSAASNTDTEAGVRFDQLSREGKAHLLLLRAYCNALKAGTYQAKTLADIRADYIAAYKAVP